jgi:hypothetical protein
MAYSQSAINLGDLARALEDLKPDDEATRRAIALTLGLDLAVPESQEKTSKEKGSPLPKPPQPGEIGGDRNPFMKSSVRPIASLIEHTASEERAPSIYVPPLEPSKPEDDMQPPPLEPLFFPRWTRGILSASLATDSTTGPPDVERIVQTLARGMCLHELPMLPSPTLTRGVQLLIDRSQAMLPFIRDQIRLREEILRVVGSDRVSTMRFVGCPLRGAGEGPEMSWSQYEPPLPGTPVLLLTDLGIGRPRLIDERASVTEWRKFAQLVKKAQCPLVAFVPYLAARWPQALRRHLTIIQWDRKTTATTVRNRVKRAHEVRS